MLPNKIVLFPSKDIRGQSKGSLTSQIINNIDDSKKKFNIYPSRKKSHQLNLKQCDNIYLLLHTQIT